MSQVFSLMLTGFLCLQVSASPQAPASRELSPSQIILDSISRQIATKPAENKVMEGAEDIGSSGQEFPVSGTVINTMRTLGTLDCIRLNMGYGFRVKNLYHTRCRLAMLSTLSAAGVV